MLSSGAAWSDLPTHFGNWNSIYHKFRLWYAQDIFENILKALVADTEKYLLVQIDSSDRYIAWWQKQQSLRSCH
ncbi:MAG: transposase [Selenomonadaceae bacterium]|nr:transposase [Selenomonadaceae bacterium]